METTTNPNVSNLKLQNRSLTVNDLKAQREAELREQSKAKLEEQRNKFNEIAQEKAKEEKMRIIFDKLDLNKDNSISPEEFEKMLLSWGLEFSKENIEHILKSFSTTKKASLNFSEFKTITEFLIKIKSTFLKYDMDNNGNIDKPNVSKALEELAFKLPLDSLKKLTTLFDTDKSGETEFQEFIALMLYINDLQKLFLGADKDRSNILDAAELHSLLRTMGIALTPLEIEIFMAKIAPEAKKGIDFAGFVDLMLKLRDQREQIAEEARKQREDGKKQLTAKPLKETANSLMGATSPRGTMTSPRASGASDGHKVLEKRIMDECTKNKKLWEDPDFPAAPQSLYRKLAAKSSEVKSWKRPSELSTKAKLFQNGCDEGDIKQGSLGDCWFLSAISVVAQLGNTEIEHLFVSQHPECGFYQVGFFRDREFTVITVDDRIPCGISGRPIYAHCADSDEFWVPIVEKAFAKMHGCYENIIAGIPSDALVDLTGESAESHEIENSDKFWRDLLHFTKEKYLMGSASNNRKKRIDLGIIDEHAYGVFEARLVEGHKLVRIRNPWGGTEWKGRWCDGSKEWTDFPRVKSALNHQFVDDGTFWMCFEDFCQEYTILYVLRMLTDNYGDKYEKYSLVSEWKGDTAGGCINNNTWYKNPQWLISTNESDCDVTVSLSLPDSRAGGNATFPAVGIMIMAHKKGASNKKMQCKPEEVIVMPNFKPARETTASFVMSPGDTYAVIPSTFHKGTESKFFLNIFSKKRIVVKEPVSEDLSGRTIKGKWAKGKTAGGCANHPTWGLNPQYVLTVKAAGEVTIALEQLTENLTHIGYTVMKGDGTQRRKPEMKDAVGNSGSFVNSAQVSADFKMTPGEYIIVPSTFRPHEELEFNMRVEGDVVSEFKPVLEWETVTFAGKYATKSGGCQNNRDTWTNNPTFKFEVPKKTRLGITVAFNEDTQGYHHGFYIFGKEIVRDSIGRSSFVPTTSAVTQHFELDVGTYHLLVCSFNPGLVGNFTVTMFADVKVKI